MSIPAPLSADFDHPIEMLDACHEHIRRQCALIEKLAAHLLLEGADAEAREAARGVLRFFDTAGAHHHQDEEEGLFPMLYQLVPSAQLNRTSALIHRLLADHEKLETRWDEMRMRLMAVTFGSADGLTGAIARRFSDAYERHIVLEEEELLPLARRLLDERRTEALGRSMARRRGVTECVA